MPELIDPTRSAFLLDPDGGPPVLVLAAGREVDSIPPLGFDPAAISRWELRATLTQCSLEGPGETGFVIRPLGTPGVARWCEAAWEYGRVVLVMLADGALSAGMQPEQWTAGGARGGVVRVAPPDAVCPPETLSALT